MNNNKNTSPTKLIVTAVALIAVSVAAIAYYLSGYTPSGGESSVYDGAKYDSVYDIYDGMEAGNAAEPLIPDNAEVPEVPEDTTPWYLILVNRDNPLPEDFTVETVEFEGGELVDKRIAAALSMMLADAEADGFYGKVVSGYRTREAQQGEIDARKAAYIAEGFSEEDADDEAKKWVALPGTSEHETGLAVDINADGVHSAGYEVYGWLAENAYKYGFICRYTSDKQLITGISPEPWHYRYVGLEDAKAMFESGMCLEEYTKQLTIDD